MQTGGQEGPQGQISMVDKFPLPQASKQPTFSLVFLHFSSSFLLEAVISYCLAQ